MSDLTKLPKEIILDMINATTGKALPAGAITFGLPTASTGDQVSDGNTALTVSSVEGSGYSGDVQIVYNRINFADIGAAVGNVAFPLGDATTLADFVADINSRFGINLQPEDFEDVAVPEFTGTANESHTLTLTAKADSLIFIGSLDLTIDANDIPLNTVITVQKMNGLTYEAPAAPAQA